MGEAQMGLSSEKIVFREKLNFFALLWGIVRFPSTKYHTKKEEPSIWIALVKQK